LSQCLTILAVTATLIAGNTISVCSRLVHCPQRGIEGVPRINVDEVIARTISPVGKPEALNKGGGETTASDDVQSLLKFLKVGKI